MFEHIQTTAGAVPRWMHFNQKANLQCLSSQACEEDTLWLEELRSDSQINEPENSFQQIISAYDIYNDI